MDKVELKGEQPSTYGYVGNVLWDDHIILDGEFSIEDLKAIIKYMKNKNE